MKNHEAFYNTDIASGPWTSPTLTLTGTIQAATPAAAAISPRIRFSTEFDNILAIFGEWQI